MKTILTNMNSRSFRKNIVLIGGLMVLLGTTFSSCKKFLDIDSPNDVNGDEVITSAAGLLSARIGLYNSLQNDAYYGGYFPLMIDAYSDNGAAGGYDSPQLNQFNDKALSADNIFLDNYWVAGYNSVYTANQILANVDNIDDPQLSDEVRNDVKGEAYTVRALAHFDLLRTFGEHWDMNSGYGIPLVMDAIDPLQPRGRNTVQECYDAIVGDLTAALDLVSNDDVESGSGSKTAAYITQYFVEGLLARVYLYMQDYDNAAAMADEVIASGIFSLTNNPALIYTTKLSNESIFELQFNVQDQSQYNNLTYVRDDALRVDVSFLANEDLGLFFETRLDDLRAQSVDFDPDNNDGSIQPDGRTQKYRGEETKDNSAYIIRIAEMYLIAAEAKGLNGGGLDYLNILREMRGLGDLFPEDFDTPEAYEDAVQDERRAELNFEGHRYFDLARIGKVSEIVGEDVLPVFPIPANQVSASDGTMNNIQGISVTEKGMPKLFQSINPFDQSVIAEHALMDEKELQRALDSAAHAYESWRKTSFQMRRMLINQIAEQLRSNKEKHARIISMEMGKILAESRAEVEKCAVTCEYYAQHGEAFLRDEMVNTDAKKTLIAFQPVGAVFGIMPWNFPFWQVIRAAIPTIMAGNVFLLKHAPNVMMCAKEIEKIFLEAGLPSGVFQSLVVDIDVTEKIIASDIVQGVTLTGSEFAGSSVAALAGKHIKKSVLELGGSDPLIVLEDADFERASKVALQSRMQNAGQSCIASKRFIVMEKGKDEFVQQLLNGVRQLKQGNQLEEATTTGPMARIDLAEKLEQQEQKSLKGGAQLITGGTRKKANFQPTLLTNVKPGIPAFDEEMFGPVAAIITVKDEAEAIRLANKNQYGLGASVWTNDLERGERIAREINSGAVFINALVKSDARYPFGGVKKSGYGRELGRYGMHEFVNAKTIYIDHKRSFEMLITND